MEFKEVLDKYLKLIGLSTKELAEKSGLTTATISRYHTGERLPSFNSPQLKNLVEGITKIANEKNINISSNDVWKDFKNSYGNNAEDFEKIRINTNSLVESLEINTSDISNAVGLSSSYFSRICNGKRSPADVNSFVDLVCKYVVSNYSTDSEVKLISSIIKTDPEEFRQNGYILLKTWLINNSSQVVPIENFLEKLDDFDLNEYIEAIKFDKIKVPTLPFQIPTSKMYYGLDELKEGELDFFKTTVLSKNPGTIFMFNDMPMEDMSKDMDFGKKWMIGIAMSLKKGLHINIVHNLDRPFNELLLGLESWIPMYMTGQISPYYFTQPNSQLFYHTLYVSDVAALSGSGIRGQHDKASYYFTSKKTELPIYREREEALLKKASPLMEIYDESRMDEFEDFKNKELQLEGDNIQELHNEDLTKTFKNMKFTICKDKWLIITKTNAPTIHFVIYHKKLRNTIENFIAPYVE